jgi:hypothetical protein
MGARCDADREQQPSADDCWGLVSAPGAVKLVDAHHHLWNLACNHYPWLSDQPKHFFLGPYDTLRRDYLPEDYLRDARGQRAHDRPCRG